MIEHGYLSSPHTNSVSIMICVEIGYDRAMTQEEYGRWVEVERRDLAERIAAAEFDVERWKAELADLAQPES